MASFGYTLLLVLTAAIWGSGFVAQIEGNAFGPFTFSCIRCFIAAGFLALTFKILDIFGKSPRRPHNREERILHWKAGFFCGLALCTAMNLQQLGMYLGTSAGKSGFLTACYIVLVPVVRLILGHRISAKTWACVVITTFGLYLLCIKDGFSLELSDGVSLLCALAFSIHILVIDKFVNKVDPIRVSAIQFLTIGVLTAPLMIVFDMKFPVMDFSTIAAALVNPRAVAGLCFAAFCSSGIAYTLQIVAQDKVTPTIASLTMSLESVFAVFAGWAVLGEQLSAREICGCAIMMVAIVFAQLRR
ncbi:EamA-like transporter family protein [Fibrobacter sp. UWB15]|uniref:DMT family transporter n=1 Tax=unclassified Fibrobacter TaxID=2634177 RepID=UPI000915538D|nr:MULTISPECIES: DMT family transporter [unclassified Fibrobacter]PWJ67201.1 EamA-like transporter family protein [Fibrobacter sp. UWB6]SHF61005.1 EamA-like transporter family protein [Fibrobacter sp. UWB8]SMG07716.1 EamA-like transporter family protein [Fibrobacter sp. UWB15]